MFNNKPLLRKMVQVGLEKSKDNKTKYNLVAQITINGRPFDRPRCNSNVPLLLSSGLAMCLGQPWSSHAETTALRRFEQCILQGSTKVNAKVEEEGENSYACNSGY